MTQLIIRQEPGTALSGALFYDEAAYSFRYEADPSGLDGHLAAGGVTSVSIGTLQIEVDVESGQALYAWGFHPHLQWAEARLAAPAAEPGRVVFEPPEPFAPGVSVEVAPVGGWRTWHDRVNGWVRVGPDPLPDDTQVRIAEGVVLGGRGEELHSVWLHPALR